MGNLTWADSARAYMTRMSPGFDGWRMENLERSRSENWSNSFRLIYWTRCSNFYSDRMTLDYYKCCQLVLHALLPQPNEIIFTILISLMLDFFALLEITLS